MIKAVLGVGRVAQVVEWLLNKHKALSSNSNIAKKKKKSIKAVLHLVCRSIY
jgi:hypothetical protein